MLDYYGKDDPILNLIPKDSYAASGDHAELYLGGSGGLIVDGKKLESLYAQLNTAMSAGSPSIIFAARLHAQCEVHAFVEGLQRAWLADVIEKGLEDKVLRIQPDDERWNRGWVRVMDLLRERDDEPVVTSFSVCRQFPHPHIEGELSEEEAEAFYALPVADKWGKAMSAIRKIPGLQWHPDDFLNTTFGDGWHAFSLRDYAERTFPVKGGMFDREAFPR
jgi:hypothetical protein